MKKTILFLIFSLLISSCASHKGFYPEPKYMRFPASNTDDISYYLSIDKFKYYLNEYSVAMDGKIPEEIITELKSISIEDLLKMNLSHSDLEDAANYDQMIYDHLKSKSLISKVKKEDLKWSYNFFRNKLNEAYVLTPSKLDMDLSITGGEKATEREIPVEKALYAVDEMTLDSGHYISNRTTRAIFWEAIENDRTIEFHLGDSREFLKTLKAQDGKILFEVRPLAKNYNKIFIVQYPGESSYRYAITNIGGKDRLSHLTNQISLSNLAGKKLKTKVVIKGDVEKFHNARTEEHVLQLKHLPKADRVIIGQKESIDGKFNIFWKMKSIRSLYDDEPAMFKSIDKVAMEKFFKLEESDLEVIFKDKKIVEDIFLNFETYFAENPEKAPAKFKIFNYDNFTIEMCDYVFSSKSGKNVRWRVVSNVWGDEIVPIARALKATGHTNVTYMGTAGAFADKGYKVGDLVIPNAVVDADKKITVKSNAMKIEGAKYGGSVEHVGSPFEETTAWLAKARARSEFVEVETSYLRQIFNSPTDNVEMYLLVSDILGSDSETLAHATSGKRKNAQNKLLAELFKRDAGSIPNPLKLVAASKEETLRNLIDTLLAKKSIAYRYLVFSEMKSKSKVTEEMISEFASKTPVFSDAFLIEKLVRAGEAATLIKNSSNIDFDISFNKSLVDGTFNPKIDKIEITFIPKDSKNIAELSKHAKKFAEAYPAFEKTLKIEVSSLIGDLNFAKSKLPQKIDPDIFLKIYAYAGLANSGIIRSITYNGNMTLSTLPTSNFGIAPGVFEYGSGVKGSAGIADKVISGGKCADAMQAFLKMLH